MAKIVQKGAKVLREKAKEVSLSKIKSPEIQKVLRDLKGAVNKEEDGVAIAAPQIGKSLQIFVIASRAFEIINEKNKKDSHKKQEEKPGEKMAKQTSKNHNVFINPIILKASKEKSSMEEGCLSVRWLYGKVERSKKIKVRAYSEKGEVFEIGVSGLLAQIYQHEIDHLHGVLFIDKANNVEDLSPTLETA